MPSYEEQGDIELIFVSKVCRPMLCLYLADLNETTIVTKQSIFPSPVLKCKFEVQAHVNLSCLAIWLNYAFNG